MSDMELLRRLLASNEPRRMSDAAQDLGVLLTSRDVDRQVRALDLLHDVRTESEFGRGFVLALRNVFNSVLGTYDREASDAELSRVAERDGLRDVLSALYEGQTRPTRVAEQTGLGKSRVTALLRELEGMGLVETSDEEPGDARAKPRSLTPRGLGLARRLADHAAAPVFAEVSATVAAVLECFATLVSRQHVARADLSDILDRRLHIAASVRALSALQEEAHRLGLAVEQDATFWHVEAHLHTLVEEHLARATEGDSDALRALVPSLATDGRRTIVRTGKFKDAWSRLIQKQCLVRVEVVGPGEARVDWDAPAGRFDVLYDSGIEVRSDLATRNCQAFIDPAELRWIHTVSQSAVPENGSFRCAPLEA